MPAPIINGGGGGAYGTSPTGDAGGGENYATKDIPVAQPIDPNDDEDDLTGGPGDIQETYSSTFRNLVDEAVSLDHLMDHYPKNPHCHTCQVGKLQPQQSRRSKGLGPPPVNFGD